MCLCPCHSLSEKVWGIVGEREKDGHGMKTEQPAETTRETEEVGDKAGRRMNWSSPPCT